MDSFRVLGLNVEKYTQEYLDSDDYCESMEIRTRPADRYYIYVVNTVTGEYSRILLDEDHTQECYSGYTIASYGIMQKEAVFKIPKLTYIPKNPSVLDIEFSEDIEEFKCELFEFALDGGCAYYPEGFVKVFMEKFRKC